MLDLLHVSCPAAGMPHPVHFVANSLQYGVLLVDGTNYKNIKNTMDYLDQIIFREYLSCVGAIYLVLF